jgi:hypothetical protein
MLKKVFISLLSVFTITSCSNDKTNNSSFIETSFSKTRIFFSNLFRVNFTKKQIEQKLEELSKAPVPKSLSMGAMCYEMMMPPDTASYICPVCSSRTLYKRDFDNFWYVQGEIINCRRELEKVKGVNIKLDESEFCKKCRPEVTNPRLILLINIEDTEDTLRIININSNDIRVLGEFLNGDIIHKTFNDGEEPLVNYKKRIIELLGLK